MILIVISYYVSFSCVFPTFAPLLVCMSVNKIIRTRLFEEYIPRGKRSGDGSHARIVPAQFAYMWVERVTVPILN